jgi:Rne/Rng family ribonuclease
MAPRLLIYRQDGALRCADWERDRLVAYGTLLSPGAARAGAVYLARVARIDRALGAAFVQFTDTETGMVPLVGSLKLTEGRSIVVQLRREAWGDKLAKLSRAVALTGRHLELRPGRPGMTSYPQVAGKGLAQRLERLLARDEAPSHGFAARPAAADADDATLRAEAAALVRQWEAILRDAADGPAPRLLTSGLDALDLFLRDRAPSDGASILCIDRTTATQVEQRAARAEARVEVDIKPAPDWLPSIVEIEEALLEALEPSAEIPGGGVLHFDKGQALTAIDVDAADAAARAGKAGSAEDRRFAINRAAAQEVARQLRLRNLGGPIVIDYIGLRRPEHRRGLVASLREACLADPQPCQILEMSALGLVEMIRQPFGPTLAEQRRGAASSARTG